MWEHKPVLFQVYYQYYMTKKENTVFAVEVQDPYKAIVL